MLLMYGFFAPMELVVDSFRCLYERWIIGKRTNDNDALQFNGLYRTTLALR